MSLQSRISDLVTAIGTDIKQLRTWVTGSSSGSLTGLTTASKTSIVSAINEVNAKPSASAASETVAGVMEIATQAETSAGTDDARAVSPLKLQQRWSTLSAIATSGSASDLTGTLPSSVLPPLAINETFTPVSQAAMLALSAQRGDMAIRQDNGLTYVLSTDSPATLADWKVITAAGSVVSVNGQTGVVALSFYTQAELGNPETDLVALYTTAKT